MQDRVIAKQLKNEQHSVVDMSLSQSVSLETIEPAAQHLKRTRILKKLSLAEIAAALKISEEYLIAIEETQLDRLPPQVYTLGFIRSYANFLGLDGKELVAQYKAAIYVIDPPQLTTSLLPLTQEKMLVSTKTLIISLASIAILMASGWYFGSFRNQAPDLSRQEQEMKSSPGAPSLLDPKTSLPDTVQSALLPPSPPSALLAAGQESITSSPLEGSKPHTEGSSIDSRAKPASTTSLEVASQAVSVEKTPTSPTEPASSRALPVSPNAIVIKAQKKSWVRITDPDGTMPVDRVLKEGESVSFSLKEAAFLSTGNVGGLLIEYKGKMYHLKGKMGEVKTKISLAPKVFLDYLDRVLP